MTDKLKKDVTDEARTEAATREDHSPSQERRKAYHPPQLYLLGSFDVVQNGMHGNNNDYNSPYLYYQ